MTCLWLAACRFIARSRPCSARPMKHLGDTDWEKNHTLMPSENRSDHSSGYSTMAQRQSWVKTGPADSVSQVYKDTHATLQHSTLLRSKTDADRASRLQKEVKKGKQHYNIWLSGSTTSHSGTAERCHIGLCETGLPGWVLGLRNEAKTLLAAQDRIKSWSPPSLWIRHHVCKLFGP